ncbi:5-methylcytosine-specific restriction endonuclease McrA [Gordonia amarae]|nr:5-methylcytosine-specific restriction endonuclease McrA [Gordonia amarae]
MKSFKPPPVILNVSAVDRKDSNGHWRSWDSSATVTTRFKEKFRAWALGNQDGRCAFCRLSVGDLGHRRQVTLDHFIPKANYPEWTFEPLNLLVACGSCNSSIKTSNSPLPPPPVSSVPQVYNRLPFTMFHPYLNGPESAHFQGGYPGGRCKPTPVKGISPQGKETIAQFKLDNPSLYKSWCAEYRGEVRKHRIESLPPRLRDLVLKALGEVA